MRYLGNKRRLAALGVLGAAVGLTLLVVLPALGSTPYQPVLPASTSGVIPTDYPIGGQSGICGTLFPGFTGSEYDNNNPKTTKHGTIGPGITLQVATDISNNGNPANSGGSWPAYGNDKYFSYTATGLAVVGVGVNGGSDTTKYDYRNDSHVPSGYVSGDGYLHAPAQSVDSSGNPTSLYSISHLTFCYAPLITIKGNVYEDLNQNGQNDSGSDTPLGPGWTVRLYRGVTPGTPTPSGTPYIEATTDAGGAYEFDNVVADSSLRLCEVPANADPPGPPDVWVQTEPKPSTATLCTGVGERPKGYDVDPASNPPYDFGNAAGFTCQSAPVGTTDYTVGECKAEQTYVFNKGTLNDVPFVDYWVGDPTKATIPVVELVNFDDPIDPSTGQPKYTKLLFADGGAFPVTLGNLLTMPYCKIDPRDSSDPSYPDTFVLDGSYQPGDVLPGVYPDANTSCVISIKVTAGPDNTGTLQAYVYALGDSIRSVG